MPDWSAAAIANSNIALIKYWGNVDARLRLPANGSISMNLAGLETHTQVTFDPTLCSDELWLNGQLTYGAALWRVSEHLERVRALADLQIGARVVSSNNFPTGAGIASSASAFAALSLAASRAAGLHLDERQLSHLARRASGSACRSAPSGFVEWQAGTDDASSYAYTIFPPEHWALTDCVAVISRAHKSTGSTQGHALAGTSPLQAARLADTPRRLELCRHALRQRDFAALAEVIEQDSHLMHAVMMTGAPAVLYWQPATLAVMQAVAEWRGQGLPAACTIDAGPNVHVIGPAEAAPEIQRRLLELPGVLQVLSAGVGGPARLAAEPG